MESIITSNLEEITLSSKLLRLETSRGDLLIDIQKMMSEPVNSENAYFNATRVAELYGREKELNAFTKLKSTKEYIKLLEEEFALIPRNSRNQIKTHYTKRGRETKENKGTFGTYLHNELFFKYLSWCDVRFEREMHKIFKQIIIHTNELKIERDNTKILFKDLSKTIKDIYIPNQESDNAKKFAFSTITTLTNMEVLGCMASKYARDNNIEVENGKSIRDYLSKEQLQEITDIEEHINGVIKYGKIYDYHEIKAELQKIVLPAKL